MTKKPYFKIFSFLTLVFAIYFSWIHLTHAQLGFDLFDFQSLFLNGIAGVVYGFARIAAIFVELGANLVNWALNLNANVTSSPLVQAGWLITRDLANLGFVLAIIIIAFATILRMENYAMKKTLITLITSALLINFSLVIAGVFVDFAGMLTSFFINAIGSPQQIASGLVNGLQVNKLMQIAPGASLASVSSTITSAMTFIISIFFVIIFTLIAAVALFITAGMLLIRYLYLTMCLIAMPLAWFARAVPALESQEKRIWGAFFKWLWFAPSAAFFIYLAIRISSTPGAFGTPNALGTATAGTVIADFVGVITNMVAVIGFLVLGLIASEEVGSGMAKSTTQFIKGQGDKLRAYPGQTAQRMARTIGYRPPDEKGRGGGSLLQRGAAKLTGIPGVGGAAQRLNQWAIGNVQTQSETFKKELAGLDSYAFLQSGKNWLKMGDPAYALAYGNMAADNDQLKNLDQGVKETIMVAARNAGPEAEAKFTQRDPRLAKLGVKDGNEGRKKVGEALRKVKADEIPKKVPAEAFTDADVTFNLSPKQAEVIFKSGTVDQINAIRQTVHAYKGDAWEKLDPDLQAQYKNPQEWQAAVSEAQKDFADINTNPALQAQYKSEMARLEDQVRENIAGQRVKMEEEKEEVEIAKARGGEGKILMGAKQFTFQQ